MGTDQYHEPADDCRKRYERSLGFSKRDIVEHGE